MTLMNSRTLTGVLVRKKQKELRQVEVMCSLSQECNRLKSRSADSHLKLKKKKE